MSILSTIIFKEEKRNESMIQKYKKELESLPKGKIMMKNINSKTYFYLCYRDGKKVISKYIGKDKNEIVKIQDDLIRRNQIMEILEKLEKERNMIKKMEAVLWFYIMVVIW